MTDHVSRLYALVVAVVLFFVAWAIVAAHPWAPRPAADPRLAALAARQQRIHLESVKVSQIVNARWAAYHRALAAHSTAVATQVSTSQPSVKVVNLPPLVVTRTS